jgi:hypothetical protein
MDGEKIIGTGFVTKLNENILANNSIGDKVFAFGCKNGTKAINQDEGKIVGIGPEQIESSSCIDTEIAGGPLIALESENALGIVKCQKRVIKKKEGYVPFAVRFDNIENFEEYSNEQIVGDLAISQKISDTINNFTEKKEKFAETAAEYQAKMKDTSSVNLAKISSLESSLKQFSADVSRGKASAEKQSKSIKLRLIKKICDQKISELASLDKSSADTLTLVQELHEDYVKWWMHKGTKESFK